MSCHAASAARTVNQGREQSIELFGVVRARAGEHRAADDQSSERVVLSQRRFEGQVRGAACGTRNRATAWRAR